jgi:predicted nucleotidyltransferase
MIRSLSGFARRCTKSTARTSRASSCTGRARGDAHEESDYDVAIFLQSLPDRWRELDRLAALRVKFLDDASVFFDARPYAAAAYLERTPLMREIRRDGLEL